MPTDSPFAASRVQVRAVAVRAFAWAGGVAWLVAVTLAFVWMTTYGAAPGQQAVPPQQWPANTAVELDRSRPTLVLFAHPHCGCTRATLAELDRLLARCQGRLASWTLFYTDPEMGPQWERTDTWERASAIPGVRTGADPLARTARLFGAVTSGTVVVYGPDGALRFHGGITASRGHEGDSAGKASIEALAMGEPAPVATTPVFGCSLVAREGTTR